MLSGPPPVLRAHHREDVEPMHCFFPRVSEGLEPLLIDKNEIARAVKVLRESSRIVFFGIGASGLVGIDAEQKFSRINKMCHSYTDGHSQLTAATLLDK